MYVVLANFGVWRAEINWNEINFAIKSFVGN